MDKIIDSYTDRGYIYILDHSSYKGNIKISRTNNLKNRLGSHCCAHIENPQMIFTIEAINYKLAEKLVHQRLGRYKVNCQSSREFFCVDIKDAIEIIKEVIYVVNNPIVIDTNE
jgi:hypothetical protein